MHLTQGLTQVNPLSPRRLALVSRTRHKTWGYLKQVHTRLKVGYCGRCLDGSEPRYRFPAGFAKSQVLFNLHRAAAMRQSTVIVVEGFFDCLKGYQAGFDSVVTLMGPALYEPQRWLLVRRFRQIVLMLDGDAPGRRAAAIIPTKLSADCSVGRHRATRRKPPAGPTLRTGAAGVAGKGGQSETH
jgi:DNA primase